MPRRLVALWFVVAILWSPLHVLVFGPPLSLSRGSTLGYLAVTFVLTFVTCALTIRRIRERRD